MTTPPKNAIRRRSWLLLFEADPRSIEKKKKERSRAKEERCGFTTRRARQEASSLSFPREIHSVSQRGNHYCEKGMCVRREENASRKEALNRKNPGEKSYAGFRGEGKNSKRKYAVITSH